MDNGAQAATAATLAPPRGAGFVVAPRAPRSYCLSVIIPVYNEHATLLELLRRVEAVHEPLEILLVDDGSTDGTREVLQTKIENRYPNVRVLYHPTNQGKGAAILTAIKQAGGDFIVIQDADLEYDPQDYSRLLAPLLSGRADVVYGSRFKGSIVGMKTANLLANRILTRATNLLFPGANVSDEATCYKMFRRSVLMQIPLRARRFDFCPEVTAKVLKRGLRIVEIPIAYRARTSAQGKKICWTDGIDALWALIKYRFID